MRVIKHTVLDQPAAVSLIVYLYKTGPVVGKNLKGVVSNYPRMKRLAEQLRDEGMISIKMEKRPMITLVFSLTEKGKELAGHLKAASDMLSPIADSYASYDEGSSDRKV